MEHYLILLMEQVRNLTASHYSSVDIGIGHNRAALASGTSETTLVGYTRGQVHRIQDRADQNRAAWRYAACLCSCCNLCWKTVQCRTEIRGKSCPLKIIALGSVINCSKEKRT